MFCWYFICFLFQTAYRFIFMSYSLIYVFICLLFEIKKLFCLLVLFPHMRLCILFSVLENIQVDSIELLSTLATDG